MSDHASVDGDICDSLQEVLQEMKCIDWGAKVQDVCERCWALLDENHGVAPVYMSSLIKLLQTEEAFAVARLVIPELRGALGTMKAENKHKQQIMNDTMNLRDHFTQIETRNQAHFDHDNPLYCVEKDIFMEAEMYRAGLLLYNSGSLDETQKQDVREWLAARPGNTSNTHGEGVVE